MRKLVCTPVYWCSCSLSLFKGNLWEELRNDSLALDSLVVMDTTPFLPQLSPSQVRDSVGVCEGLAETEGGMQGSVSGLYLSGLCTTAFTSTDNMSALISSSGNTPIPLLWESYLCVASHQAISTFSKVEKVIFLNV